MTGQKLKIIFLGDQGYLTGENPMTLSQLGLPDIAKSFVSPAYWMIEVLHFNEKEKKIFCEVLSYHVGDTDFTENQLRLADQLNHIELVRFRNINTSSLIKTLAGNTPLNIVQPKYNHKETFYNDLYHSDDDDEEEDDNLKANEAGAIHASTVHEPVLQNIILNLTIPFKEIQFEDSGVFCKKKIKGFKLEKEIEIEFTIPNEHIRKSYEPIKLYFAKALQLKEIQARVDIELTDQTVTKVTAISPEIDKIGDQLVDQVRFKILKATRKKKSDFKGKSLHTMEEYFEQFGEGHINAGVFYNNDLGLLNDLITLSKTKHAQHLAYLAGNHVHQVMRLRFVQSPVSFIFLLQGHTKYHIVWETLDTEEATYIWQSDKSLPILKMELANIETIICGMRNHGKTAYIQSTDDPFSRVYHDYSSEKEGYEKWKTDLEKMII